MAPMVYQVISIKLKAKYRFHAAVILYYILQKICFKQSCIFFEDFLP